VYDRLREEVRLYSETLAEKPHVLLLTKRDLLPPDQPLPTVEAPESAGVLAVSSATGSGVEELKEFLWKFVATAKQAEGDTTPAEDFSHAAGYWEFMDDE
jgi:GTPase